MLAPDINLKTFVNLIDNAYDEVFIWDCDLRVVYANKACYRHYGFLPEEFIGKQVDELVLQDALWSPTIVSSTFSKKKPLMQKQKTVLGIEMVTISVPVFGDNGKVEFVVQTIRDTDEFLYKEVEPVTRPVGGRDMGKPSSNPTVFADSLNMQRIMKYLKKVAPTKAPILILGETGVGKTFIARKIHEMSNRRNKPFVTINMASLSPSVIESEIFGYEAGAFTGARKEGKKGIFEVANGGTLFLDEIGDFPFDLQAKFLHVIQDENFIPVGGTKAIDLDVRMIYATNCNLRRKVESGNFRKDLYQRINMMELTIPPLRQRKEDLHSLTNHFLKVFNEKYSRTTKLSAEVLKIFDNYQWSGNIRELSNVIERTVIIAETDMIRIKDLPESFFSVDYFGREEEGFLDSSDTVGEYEKENKAFANSVDEYQRELIIKAYREHPSSRKLAVALNISQSKANRLIRKYIKK